MKKQLFNFFLLILFANAGFSQQSSRSSNTSYALDNSYLPNAPYANPKGGNSSAVITTTTSTCMSVNLPAPAAWTLVNYGTGTPIFTDGFVSGPNIYLDKEKAMYFDVSASANSSVTHVYVGFGHAYSATQSKIVTLRLYNGTTANVVGAQLTGAVATLTMGEIMSDVALGQYSDFVFATPVALPASKKFYASVDITNLTFPSDSLSIVSNSNPQTTPSPAWEKQSNNVWYNYSNAASSWSLNISLLIHPFLIQSPVISTFTASNGTVCAGNSINYNSAGSTSTGTYYWSFGASLPTSTSSVAAPTAISYPTMGTYTTYLLVNDACGSYAVSSKTILVNPTPVVGSTPASTNVCAGSNVTLNGTGASSYAWSGGITNNVPFTANSSVNYTVTGTAVNGCTNTAVSSVVVSANPTVTINSSTTTLCSGNSVTLTASGAVTYAWTGGVNNGVGFVPSGSGSYTVTGTQGICSGTAAVNITVNPTPTVAANITATTVCAGTNITLSGSGATSYAWSGGITNATPFAASTTTNYVVTGTSGACSGTAAVAVTVNNNPTVTANTTASVVCTGNNVTLSGGGANTYTWTGGVTDAAPFTPTGSATYTVTGSSSAGCTSTATVSVTVSLCTGVSTNFNNTTNIRLYPNPNNGIFTIESANLSKEATVVIYDNIGKLVYKQNLDQSINTINTSFATGMYVVKVIDNNSVQSVHKLIIK